jgi:hypothetical protein
VINPTHFSPHRAVFLGQEYSFPADVYSFSVVLFHLVTGIEAYTGFKDPLQFANQVCTVNYFPFFLLYLSFFLLFLLVSFRSLSQIFPSSSHGQVANSNYRCAFPPDLLPFWCAMVAACWDATPEKRPTSLMLMEQLDSYIQNQATTATHSNGVPKTEEELREEFVYI